MSRKRYLFFWLYYAIGYIFPLVYFICKLGVTKEITSVVLPVLFIAVIAVFKLCTAIPAWVSTWRPGVTKGILYSIPTYLLFILLITIGLTLKYVVEKQVEFAFALYFEVVLVVFGSLCVASIPHALHLKYKELDLIDKGFVLGTVRK